MQGFRSLSSELVAFLERQSVTGGVFNTSYDEIPPPMFSGRPPSDCYVRSYDFNLVKCYRCRYITGCQRPAIWCDTHDCQFPVSCDDHHLPYNTLNWYQLRNLPVPTAGQLPIFNEPPLKRPCDASCGKPAIWCEAFQQAVPMTCHDHKQPYQTLNWYRFRNLREPGKSRVKITDPEGITKLYPKPRPTYLPTKNDL